MKPVSLYLLFINIVIVVCLFLGGCGGIIAAEGQIADELTKIDEKTHSVLAIATTSGKIIHYAAELHKAGVDTEVLMTISDAINKVHEIAEKEHQKHVERE